MKTKQCIKPDEIDKYISALRTLGKSIVLMQGCYDQLHIGHKRFLEKGKQEGDILIVAFDSDELTRDRKGATRPIIPQDERGEMLLGLECVDYVIRKELTEDIDYLAKKIKPDVLIISESTKDFADFEKRMREKHAGFCGKVVCFEQQAQTSTSANIAKIVQAGNIEFFRGFFEEMEAIVEKYKQKMNGHEKT